MGLQLPGELIYLLGMLGYTWPEADEQALFQMGQSWMSFSGDLSGPVEQAHGHAQQVWSANTGAAVEAFEKAWNQPDSPRANLGDATLAATMVGAGLFVCAGIVLALKIQVIVQLVMLAIQIAQAIALAVPTFGASLAQIPIFKMITGILIDLLIGMALTAILGG